MKVFYKYFNLCEKTYLNDTDGQTTCCGITALCVASRGKDNNVQLQNLNLKFGVTPISYDLKRLSLTLFGRGRPNSNKNNRKKNKMNGDMRSVFDLKTD